MGRLVPCSMCGKAESATDASPFCGACNEAYYAEQEEGRKAVKDTRQCRCEDCEAPGHCRNCGGCVYEMSTTSGLCDSCYLGAG